MPGIKKPTVYHEQRCAGNDARHTHDRLPMSACYAIAMAILVAIATAARCCDFADELGAEERWLWFRCGKSYRAPAIG